MADEKTFKKLKSAFELLSEIIKPKGAEENTDKNTMFYKNLHFAGPFMNLPSLPP